VILSKSPFLLLFHFMDTDLPGFLDQDGLAYLGGDGPALSLSLASANLLRFLLALLNSDVLAPLLGHGDALLLLLDAASLLGDLLAGLVAALGKGQFDVPADLGSRVAHLLFNILADLLGLIPADILQDGRADLGLLLVARLVGLLAVLLEDVLED